MEELEGVRLRAWRESAQEEGEAERADPELKEELERERKEKYRAGPVTMGEYPANLTIVVESGEVELEVI